MCISWRDQINEKEIYHKINYDVKTRGSSPQTSLLIVMMKC